MFFRKKPSDVPGIAAPARSRFAKPAAVTLVVVVIVGSLVGFRASQARKDDKKSDAAVVLEFTPADVTLVEYRELSRSIAFSGSLSPVVQTAVKSRVPGDVNRVFVREGEAVAQGQLMAQIDTTDLQSRVDSQAAALDEARARLSIADKNRENGLQLLRQKFISQNAFDTSQSTYEANVAMVRSAEAQLRIAKKALEDAAVRAPLTGIVARKHANPGEKVSVDSPLFTLVDLGKMEIEAPAPAAEIPEVKAGQAVSFRVDGFGDRAFDGRVERINPTAEPGSRSITLYISVANRDGVLRGGMFAKGQIVLAKSARAAVVPASAIRVEAGQSYVYALEGGKVTKRAVQVGASEPQAAMVAVTSGLEPGLQVVSARVSGLKPGTAAVIKAPTVAPAAAPAKAG